MANGNSYPGNGGSPGVSENIVSKMMDNLTDLSNNVGDQAQAVHALKAETAQLTGYIAKIAEKLATPPRNEELCKEILTNRENLSEKLLTLNTTLNTVSKNQETSARTIKSVIKEIRIYFIAVAAAVLITGVIIAVYDYVKDNPTTAHQEEINKKQDEVITGLKQQVEDLKKERDNKPLKKD